MNTVRPHHATLELPETAIQEEAHRLWLEKGRPEGRDLETWLEAKEVVRRRLWHDQAVVRAPEAIHFPAVPVAARPAGARPRKTVRA